jgi:hypothetical protein
MSGWPSTWSARRQLRACRPWPGVFHAVASPWASAHGAFLAASSRSERTITALPFTVGPAFPWIHSALSAQALREDRILHEIHATGSDVRRIADLFGLTVSGATRYLNTHDLPNTFAPRTLQ